MEQLVSYKETHVAKNNKFYVASSTMQGWRTSMEDTYNVYLEAPHDPSSSFFGIFDGHNGSFISQFASEHLHRYIMTSATYEDGRIIEALKEGFVLIDGVMKESDPLIKYSRTGSTAVVVLIRENHLFCANVGDSRAIAYLNGEPRQLTIDHRPCLPQETERINNAHCYIRNNRINGTLAMSRSLGDYNYKRSTVLSPSEQAVSCHPDVCQEELDSKWNFIVLASDGIFNAMSNERLGNYISSWISSNVRPEEIVERILDRCLSPNGHGPGTDNMTIILIIILNNAKESYVKVLNEASSSGDKKRRQKIISASMPSTSRLSN